MRLRHRKALAVPLCVITWSVVLCGCVVQAKTPQGDRGVLYSSALEQLPPGTFGLAVIADPGDVVAAADAFRKCASIVQVLSSDNEKLAAIRAEILDGDYKGVTVRDHRGGSLPYIDNLVSLLVLPDPSVVAKSEAERVLAPGGTCLELRASGWESWNKAWPQEMDEWSHYLHDASNNAVAGDRIVDVPRGIQWVGEPRWTRHHDHISSFSALVSSNGRLFYINDQSTSMSIHLPSDWVLVAKDAFNGATLWTRAINDWVNPLWPLKSGPASIPRRLVASKDDVYVTLGLSAPVSCLDAATGEEHYVLAGSEDTQEMILQDGVLFCLTKPMSPALDTYHPENVKSPDEQRVVDSTWAWDSNDACLKAYDVRTRRKLWEVNAPIAPLSLAASGEKAFFYDGEFVRAVVRSSGEEAWVSGKTSRRKVFAPYYGVNLVATEHVVLFAGGDRVMRALSAATGEELWQAEHRQSGYRSAEDLFVIGDWVLSGDISGASSSGVVEARDLSTGESVLTVPTDTGMRHWPHHRCYRSKATERFILSSRTGIEFCDPVNEKWFNNHWARGACLVGILPCNGLVYATPHHCLCFSASQLEGFNALSSRAAPGSEGPVERVERGPAYDRLGETSMPSMETYAWPMHRHDPRRSGACPASIGAVGGITWSTPIGDTLTSPVVAEGKVVVADINTGAVHVLDADTGRHLWRFIAGGRVDSAPTLYQGRVLFGCADGWIYCLDLSDGALAWRFFAAPGEQQHVAFDKVSSVWPVSGSILVKDDVVYAVAGRSRFTDGGIRLVKIDPVSGAAISESVLNDRRDSDGRPIQENFNDQQRKWQQWVETKEGKPVSLMTFNEVGKPDLLTVDNNEIFMRGYQLQFGETGPDALRKPRLMATWGLLSPYWSHRATWQYAGAPTSRILVFNDAGDVFGYSFTVRYQTLQNPFMHYLYGRTVDSGKATDLWRNQKVPILVRAMVLANDKLVVAGPPDYGKFDTSEAYERHGEASFQQDMREQKEAWDGRRGGLLWVIDTEGPVALSASELPSPPVFDGMAVTSAGVYICTMDGHVLFLSSH